jgi:hypothetical protein
MLLTNLRSRNIVWPIVTEDDMNVEVLVQLLLIVARLLSAGSFLR